MSLRDEAIEAMAASHYERIGGVKWSECPAKQLWREDAAADLDALVVFLTEEDGLESLFTDELLAVLGES